MEATGLLIRIYDASISIDSGRKGFATKGKAEEGRVSYEDGITLASTTFAQAQESADPEIIILAEFTFLSQELHFCEPNDNHTFSSLTQAIQSFDDAFLAIKSVVEPSYKIADNIFPHNGKYRISGYPKDSFHIACIAHRTRLQNILRSPGIDPIEKTLLMQRFNNLSTAQNAYMKMQKKVLCH